MGISRTRVLRGYRATLHASGQRTPARESRSEALPLAARCGASTVERRARRELSAIGVRPRSSVRLGPDSLTSSERREVELAAAGGSNRKLAQALFVTEETVETHLGPRFASSTSPLGGSSPPVSHGPLPDELLVLGGLAAPGSAKKVEEQCVALLVGALLDVVDRSGHERGGGRGVQAIWFHPESADVTRARILPRNTTAWVKTGYARSRQPPGRGARGCDHCADAMFRG